MPLKLNATISNKKIYAFIAIFIISVLVTFVYAAYSFPTTFLGHGGDQVWIRTPLSGEMTLQDAVDGSHLLGALSLPACSEDDYLQFKGGAWVCSGTAACIPSNACAADTCIGETCPDGCGGTCAGTKICDIVCPGGVTTTCALCVAGNGASCINSGGTWTGDQCCVSNTTTCTSGNGASCINSGGIWTGTYCCVAGICTSGNGASCINSGGIWTGTRCCVVGATACAPGNGASCINSGGTWTGDQCCV